MVDLAGNEFVPSVASNTTAQGTPETDACDAIAAQRDYVYRWFNYQELARSLETRLRKAEADLAAARARIAELDGKSG